MSAWSERGRGGLVAAALARAEAFLLEPPAPHMAPPPSEPAARPVAAVRGLAVARVRGGAMRVSVRMPFLLRAWTTPIALSASAGLPKGGGS